MVPAGDVDGPQPNQFGVRSHAAPQGGHRVCLICEPGWRWSPRTRGQPVGVTGQDLVSAERDLAFGCILSLVSVSLQCLAMSRCVTLHVSLPGMARASVGGHGNLVLSVQWAQASMRVHRCIVLCASLFRVSNGHPCVCTGISC